MKAVTLKTMLAGLITVSVIAVGATAFAGKGMGNRDGDGGRYHRGYGCAAADLTPEQQDQLDAKRKAFFEATQTERQMIMI